MDQDKKHSEETYTNYKQSLGGLIISFTIDKTNKSALLNNIDFALDRKLSPQMRLKFFCTLVRNSVSDLITLDINKIYHNVLKEEYVLFKEVTTWHTELTYVDKSNDKELIFLSCDIKDFIENMANAHGLEIF